MSEATNRFPVLLFVAYCLAWMLAAIAPWDRPAWALENLLIVVAAPVLVRFHRQRRLSRAAWVALFLFAALHAVGSHYTYSLVPYDAWTESLFGRTLSELLGIKRNHYDRLVHFAYGLLCTPACVDVLKRVLQPRERLWGALLPLSIIMASSLFYELLEWWSAKLFGGDLGQAFLGTQGDSWDAQKDMALASVGSVLALAVSEVLIRMRARKPSTASRE